MIPKDNTRIVMVDSKLFAQAVGPGGHHLGGEVPFGADGRGFRQVRTDRAQHGGRPGRWKSWSSTTTATPSSCPFNARYLLDITDQISGGSMEMRFGGPNDPALVLDRPTATCATS